MAKIITVQDYSKKIDVIGSTHTVLKQAKSQAGNIRVKHIMAT